MYKFILCLIHRSKYYWYLITNHLSFTELDRQTFEHVSDFAQEYAVHLVCRRLLLSTQSTSSTT